MKLSTVKYEMIVDVDSQTAWDALANFGDVGSHHPQVKRSKPLNGSKNEALLGSDRECIIIDGKKEIMVREKIIDFVASEYYTYEVYDWKNFPLKKMTITFGVKKNSQGKTVIYQKTDFRLKPGFLTYIMKGKLRNGAREGLLGYKHFLETGEQKTDIKVLRKKYTKV
jgi:hypothetical protein